MSAWRITPDISREERAQILKEIERRLFSGDRKKFTIAIYRDGRRERERLLWKLIADLADRYGYSREEMKQRLVMTCPLIDQSALHQVSLKEMNLHDFEIFMRYVVERHEEEIVSMNGAHP